MDSNTNHSPIKQLVWIVLSRTLPSKWYLALKYRVIFHRRISWKCPRTFTEKLQWLKLNDFRPGYVDMVDKVKVKQYVADKIGVEYTIPTFGVWKSADEIDFNSLPDKFVLKCNHDSGNVVVCRSKAGLDRDKTRRIFAKALKNDYYYMGRERPYRYVERRIFAEKMLESSNGEELLDYKFFCFNGEPRVFKINFNKEIDFHANYYDMDFNLLPFGEVWPAPSPRVFERPADFDKMVEIVKKLSEGIPFIRVDLYNVSGKIYFGELTLYPTSGFGPFNNYDWDLKLGEWLMLPSSNNGRTS